MHYSKILLLKTKKIDDSFSIIFLQLFHGIKLNFILIFYTKFLTKNKTLSTTTLLLFNYIFIEKNELKKTIAKTF